MALNSDATHPKAPADDGTGWCDPSVLFDDVFVGGEFAGLRYGDVMCGFATWTHDGELSTQADGCVELNGCASFLVYPYLKCFTLLITFVFLNLFVGIILDGFSLVGARWREKELNGGCARVLAIAMPHTLTGEKPVSLLAASPCTPLSLFSFCVDLSPLSQAEGHDDASLIREPEFLKIWEHWVTLYDPDETYCIDIFKVKSFLQTLHQPWGFGLDYVASDAELIHRVRDLDLTVGADGKIHFFKVLKGLSRRHLSLTHANALAEIDAYERNNDDRLNYALRATFAGSIPNFKLSLGSKDTGEESMSEILARMVIRKAIKRWLQRKASLGGQAPKASPSLRRTISKGGSGETSPTAAASKRGLPDGATLPTTKVGSFVRESPASSGPSGTL
jgi:hypothetical protein